MEGGGFLASAATVPEGWVGSRGGGGGTLLLGAEWGVWRGGFWGMGEALGRWLD